MTDQEDPPEEDEKELSKEEKEEKAKEKAKDKPGKLDLSKQFRNEVLVSEGDLRLESAREVVRSVAGDEEVLLQEKSLHARGDFSYVRGSRSVEVFGDYNRDTHEAELYPLTLASVRETVRGNVEYTAELEGESIMGGAYSGMVLGPYLRMAAWADFMAWGGWIEVDISRVEIAGVMIRAMALYNHAVGIRIVNTTNLVDDWQVRNETFSTLVDRMTSVTHVGGPGAGTEVAA